MEEMKGFREYTWYFENLLSRKRKHHISFKLIHGFMYLNDIRIILLPDIVKQTLFLHFKIPWEVIWRILSQVTLR